MSRIVSPYPPYEGEIAAAANASWWRLKLVPNVDGYTMITTTDAPHTDYSKATWCTWEFFDGHNAIIDTGFDKPTKVRIHHYDSSNWGFVDVLNDGPPTPSPDWQALTDLGDHDHPDGWGHP